MARTYKLTFGRRLTNSFLSTLLRLGVKLQGTYLLSVPGRKSGKIHTIPIRLIEKDGQRWLVAPYGQVNWVLNARAAGQVTISPGRTSETVTIVELGPKESAPVLKEYLKQVPIVKPYFDVAPESPFDAFEAEAPRHPVFRIVAPAINSSK
jgi:deazaflavin-dependent oxidoreductase (nitroreductase family)